LRTGRHGRLVGDAGAGQDTIKVGVIAAFSGPFADYGKQMEGGIKAWMAQHGATVAGKKIEIIYKDTTGPSPEIAKRLAQELVVRDKVDFLAGFGLTPEALAVAPIAEQAKKPMIVMNAATSIITTKSDYIARFSMTLPQISAPMATGRRRMDQERGDRGGRLRSRHRRRSGLQERTGQGRRRGDGSDPRPAAQSGIRALHPAHQGRQAGRGVRLRAGRRASIAFMKGYRERGLAEAGIKVIATGDLTDDHVLPAMGDATLGVITTFHYSAAHKSPENEPS
jgi:branched-chain amino acid transport system substrate-binding protein